MEEFFLNLAEPRPGISHNTSDSCVDYVWAIYNSLKEGSRKCNRVHVRGTDFDLLESNSIYISLHENEKNYHSGLIISWCMFCTHVGNNSAFF